MTRMHRALVLPVCAVIVATAYIFINPDLRAAASYRLQPTAAKALALGQQHFDSRKPRYYDVDTAWRYLNEAYVLDPQYPAVNHELARIAFLRGEFGSAMEYIDREIDLHGDTLPNAFYIRGLIEGYKGDYHAAALDYAIYLQHDPSNWAAINDYAWVLLKAGRTDDALAALNTGLAYFPNNAWLLNNRSIALYELGHYEDAAISALRAMRSVEKVTEQDWLLAYPGNDPRTAGEGVANLKAAIEENMHMAAHSMSQSAVE